MVPFDNMSIHSSSVAPTLDSFELVSNFDDDYETLSLNHSTFEADTASESDDDSMVLIENESETSWLVLDKYENGFSVSMIDTVEEETAKWDIVDEVYLLDDDKICSLSTMRAQVMALEIAETLGGVWLTMSGSGMGLVIGSLALQVGTDTIKTSVTTGDFALTRVGLIHQFGKNCIVGSVAGFTSMLMPVVPVYVSSCVSGVISAVSTELLDRKEAEATMKLRKETPLIKSCAWGAVTGNFPNLLDLKATSVVCSLAEEISFPTLK